MQKPLTRQRRGCSLMLRSRVGGFDADRRETDVVDPSRLRLAQTARRFLNNYRLDGATSRGYRKCGRDTLDRKSDVMGKSVSVRVALGGRRILKKNKTLEQNTTSRMKKKNKI